MQYFGIIVTLLICLIIYKIISKNKINTSKQKCPNCGKKRKCIIKNTNLTDSYKTTIMEKKKDLHKVKDKDGKIIREYTDEYEKEVPATTYVYEVDYVCKKCGERFSKEVVETKKN